MKVKGSSNEQYILESAKRLVYSGYTDYQVSGGTYVARIFDSSLRKKNVEAVLRQAVYEGTTYGDQRPLNILYLHGKFAGFLFEGTIPEINLPKVEHTDFTYGATVAQSAAKRGSSVDNDIWKIALQIVIAIIMGIVAIFGVFPFLERYVLDNVESEVVQMLYFLDYMGIPALVAGLVFQIIVLLKIKDTVSNMILCGTFALIANLLGSIIWTLLVKLLMVFVQGVIMFLMRYLIIIILLGIGFIWIKKKFFR